MSQLNNGRPASESGTIGVWGFAFLAWVAVYAALMVWVSVDLTRNFSPDSYYYVQIAGNLLDGKGFSHTTYDVAELRELDSLGTPVPTTIWAPLYPIAVACVSRLGLSVPDAALALSAVFGSLSIVCVWGIARRAYGETLATLAGSCLMVYGPLFFVSSYAWSETLALFFVSLCFLSVVLDRRTRLRRWAYPALAGVAAGLAFDTRYALLPLACVGGLLWYEPSDWKLTLRNWTLFSSGFASTAVWVLLRNLSLTGSMLGPGRPASDRGIFRCLADLSVVFTHRNLPESIVPVPVQVLLIWSTVVTVLFVPPVRRWVVRGFRDGLRDAFWEGHRKVFTLWAGGYLAFLVVYRSIVLIDPIDARLAVPGMVPLVVPVVALFVDASQIRSRTQYRLAAVVALFGIAFAGSGLARPQSMTPIEKSERLAWILNNTTARDLVIGDSLMPIAGEAPDRNLALFSVSRNAELHLKYDDVALIARKFSRDVDRVFIAVGRPRRAEDRSALYGTFVTDLVGGDLNKYPGVSRAATLVDGDIFQVVATDQDSPKSATTAPRTAAAPTAGQGDKMAQ